MSNWTRRIQRAAELEQRYSSAAPILRFYRSLASFQSDLNTSTDALLYLPGLLSLVRSHGTDVLAARAIHLTSHPEEWPDLLSERDDPVTGFFIRALEQPYFERHALQSGVDTKSVQSTCPFCFEKPAVAVLRPDRTLQCARCFTEWAFRRLLCPGCAEENRDMLPIFTSPEFPHIRIEACDTCRHYLKAVDLSRDGCAVPEVDDLASLPLDLWAVDHDYERLASNLFW
jgi:FdhE protein